MLELLPLLMFFALLFFILCGFPVAFTLAGTAVLFGFIGYYLDIFYIEDFGFVPNKIWGVMNNYTLVAVPLFIFMGHVLEKTGVADDLMQATQRLFHKLDSSLAYAVIVVGAVLAASTGIVGASVVTMGILALPAMLNAGYNKQLSAGVITASGTLGQIIPPSIVLVLLGSIMNLDVGDLFVAAIIPGMILVLLYVGYVFLLTKLKPDLAPKTTDIHIEMKLFEAFKAFLTPIALMIIVLGSILFGVASPTEAAACGASGALLIALIKGKLSWKDPRSKDILKKIGMETASVTTMVFTLLIGAQFFGIVFRGLYGDELITNFIVDNGFSQTWVLFFIMVIIFILGFFLDFLEICFIVIPVILPIMKALGIDVLWAAVLIAINLQTSFLTPPFGFALFYLKGVSPPGLTTKDIYKGVIPFIVLQIIAIALIASMPRLVHWLPSIFF